jgi:hypothetical protein
MRMRLVGTELYGNGETDRHVEANSRFWQLCELAYNLHTKNSEDQTGKKKNHKIGTRAGL